VLTLSTLARDPLSPATILVSHHVEEIPPGFTHALFLRQGRVVAQGPVAEVLTEQVLSETFGMPLRLSTDDGRYTARRRSGRHAG
jgi:iron complex transport system ATP-binding protein